MIKLIGPLLLLAFTFIQASEEAEYCTTEFMTGYLQSKLEDRFPGEKIDIVVVEDGIVVYNYPDNEYLCKNISCFLENYRSSDQIKFDRGYQPVVYDFKEEGSFLPELVPFFPTLLAEPHIVGYSAGYRTYDRVFRTDLLPVSIGDRFNLLQFKNIPYGRLYFGIEACVYAIFEAKPKSLALINADYYIGIPLTYIHKGFSTRLRLWHQSSHLGDELLVEHRNIRRFNPSMEVIDLFVAYDLFDRFTIFGGVSRVLRSDEGYKIKPNGFSYGFNYELDVFKISFCNLEAVPYIATYFTNFEENHWKFDSTVAIGYQWEKPYGHKIRLYLEAHDGYSSDGQFSKQNARYLSLKLLYGY